MLSSCLQEEKCWKNRRIFGSITSATESFRAKLGARVPTTGEPLVPESGEARDFATAILLAALLMDRQQQTFKSKFYVVVTMRTGAWPNQAVSHGNFWQWNVC
jgi:hypothetical protein